MKVSTVIKRSGGVSLLLCVLVMNQAQTTGRRWGDSLGGRVVQLVLSSAGEAALDAAVGPQPLDDSGQVVWQDALLLRRCRQGEKLAGVVLAETHSASVRWPC